MSRGTWVSIHTRARPFAYGTITLFGRTFQTVQLGRAFLTRWQVRNPARMDPATPMLQRLRAWHNMGLGYSLFARRYWGNRGCFLFLRVLRCFNSPGSPPAPMDSEQGVTVLPATGSPIRVSPDQSLLAAPRSLSQLPTPFIAFERQGIHRTP